MERRIMEQSGTFGSREGDNETNQSGAEHLGAEKRIMKWSRAECLEAERKIMKWSGTERSGAEWRII